MATAYRTTLGLIAAIQFILGIIMLVPGAFADVIGLPAAPGWVDWQFAMFGARAIGFGFGMVLATRDPHRHRSWIIAMVGVQTLDWLATVVYVAAGTVTLGQVSTAAFLPVIFAVVLALGLSRQRSTIDS